MDRSNAINRNVSAAVRAVEDYHKATNVEILSALRHTVMLRVAALPTSADRIAAMTQWIYGIAAEWDRYEQKADAKIRAAEWEQ